MRSFTRRGKSILILAILFLTIFGTAVSAQEMEKPGVAVYVSGSLPANEKKVLGAYLLTAIVKSGTAVSAENAEAFFIAAMAEEQAKGDGNLSNARIYELGKQFNIRFICVAKVTSAFDFFIVTTRMIDSEMEAVIFKGETQSPLKTIEDLTQASNKVVENMFGESISGTQTAPKAMPAQDSESAVGATTDASTATVSVTGEAKVAVERVVAAVKAFKDATAKSIDAANAVKTAAQSKNFSAIMDAKKKVGSAAEAVKKAKEDVTAAVEALNSAGPEATAAVKAMGIDLSMFARKDGGGGGAKGGKESATHAEETTPALETRNGVSLGYVYSGDVTIFQLGFAQVRPISEMGLSFVWETNVWGGWGSGRDQDYYGPGYVERTYAMLGVNIPLLVQFDRSVFSLETGVQADILGVFGSDAGAVFNAGYVVGGGLRFGFARFFYRFNYGTGYYSQMFGVRMLF